ncbi:MAG TPA: hypothetical protein VLQ89_01755, partial [Candidatus Binatia bacterium]|nr:hypothetical protein [Candidatus Binatia bacterium]
MKKILFCLFTLRLALTLLAAQEPVQAIDGVSLQKVKTELLQKFGNNEKFRIERGLEQVAGLWRSTDGSGSDFALFCLENFSADGQQLQALFEKLAFYNEILGGYFNAMSQ